MAPRTVFPKAVIMNIDSVSIRRSGEVFEYIVQLINLWSAWQQASNKTSDQGINMMQVCTNKTHPIINCPRLFSLVLTPSITYCNDHDTAHFHYVGFSLYRLEALQRNTNCHPQAFYPMPWNAPTSLRYTESAFAFNYLVISPQSNPHMP